MKKYVTLGDVCTKGSSNIAQKDIEQNNGSYGIYGASGYIKDVDFYHQDKPYIAVVKDGAGIGRTMLLPEKTSVIGTMQYLIPNDDVCVEYLYYAVTYMNLAKFFSGATIPHIYFRDYQKEKLTLLTIEEQRKIADNLRKIDRLIELCGGILQKLDVLVKSRFVEMFGEPISNPMGWECCELGDCLESIDNGKSYVCDNDCRTGDNPAILKLSAVTYGIYRPDENKAMIDEDLFDESAEVKDNDLLFTRKNTPELVGMSAYVFSTPQKLMMPDLIFRLNAKSSCNKIYLWQLINHDLFRPCIQNIANGSAKSMSNISKERLSKLTIPVPPLALQKKFAAFVEQTDKSKFIAKKIAESVRSVKIL